MADLTARLDAGETVAGAWLLSASPRAAEALSGPLDWVGIDCEHSPVSPHDIEPLVRAIESDATPLVRLPSVDVAAEYGCQQALDAGAGGVVVPGVESATEAQRAVEAATFPPAGTRGVAGTTRANDYGERFDAHVGSADPLVVAQIESPTGVEYAGEILAVDGVDVAFVGENDLSAAYAVPGEKGDERVRDAVSAVLDAAREHDVHAGIGGRTPDRMARREERGFRFFLLGADVTFAREGVESFLDAV